LLSKLSEIKTLVEQRRSENPPVTYLDTDREVERFLQLIGGTRQLAVDTEGASFHRFVDRVYLMQLSTRDHHAIIDPLPIKPPAELGAMLANPAVESVFHDADYDLRLLRRDFGWRLAKLFDTRVAAQLLGIRQFGLAALLDSFFGVKLDKKHQRADWSMRPLTPDMLAYAAQDTLHLLALRDQLDAALVSKGRRHWAEEEFERLRTVEWSADDPAEAFLRMKGARDLTRRELALLRELWKWRDGVAAQLDRATFRVVNNETLVDIIRRAPSTREELSQIRGIPRGWSSARLNDVLEAVRRGLEIPEADLPRFARAPRWDRDSGFDQRVNVLRTVRDEVARELDIDPGVLCSRDRLEAVARRVPSSLDELREVKELRQWQIEVLGERFVKAVSR
jgi:ribonuclease D